MSRWTNLFTRKRVVILALLVLTAAAIYTWQVTRTRDPVVLTYCLKYGPLKGTEDPKKVQSMSSCLQTKTLKIPAAFGNVKVTDSWYELELAYPSMEPWRLVPWLDRSSTQKLTIALHGITSQTVHDIWSSSFLSISKPVHLTPIYGLEQYMQDSWGQRQFLLPLEPVPRVAIDCAYSLGSGKPEDLTLGCAGTSYTDWHLKLHYAYRRILLSEWRTVHAKVHTFIESLVVTP